MKAYGLGRRMELDRDGGPPSRITGGRLRGRRKDRRELHKRARREWRNMTRQSIKGEPAHE